VWGIKAGDLVRTSYDTGGTIFGLTLPRYTERWVGVLIVKTWPTISILYTSSRNASGQCNINDVRREGERFLTDGNDEVFVDHVQSRSPLQLALLDDEHGEDPYPFRPDVNYGIRRGVFQCRLHGDFNATPVNDVAEVALCPVCGRYSDYMLIVMPPRQAVNRQANSYQTLLGIEVK
jgi:hypothetical protein